ncbi:MAG: hypothetical protein N3B14_03125 [Thermoleophilia bacterium]|nr:hypothetical protein [Thermoleophilia bacterium]
MAAPAPLEVTVENPLSLLGELVSVKVGGSVAAIPKDGRLVLQLKGPAEVSQIRLAIPDLHEGAQMVVSVDQVLSGTTGLATRGSTDEGTPQRVIRLRVSDAQLSSPGAYLLVARVESGGEIVAQGQAWIGKVALRQQPVDLALVLPLYLGIHRDPDDIFQDQVIQETVSEAVLGKGGLAALFSLPREFPGLAFTVVPEPVLLSQLRDLADGYVERDGSGNKTQVPGDSSVAKAAAQVLGGLRDLASNPSVEIAIAPYASPDLELLAAQGWRDGYEQLQLAKQEISHTLALSYSPRSGYVPGLVLTGDSLNYFAQAALDQVVVGGGVRSLLSGEGVDTRPVLRARSDDNERVTLVFADPRLVSLMSAPYNVGEFCAGLSYVLATENPSAIIAAPGTPESLLSAEFLAGLGRAVSGLSWLRTQTLTDLVSSHLSSSQPALLESREDSTVCSGYVEETLLARVREAHRAVTDLASAADAGRTPVEMAHKWLYLAESGWWTRQASSPRQASTGLEFAERAISLARGELAKVKVLDLRSTAIVGREGPVELLLENSAYYPLAVEIVVKGEGLVPTSGEVLKVQLEPGTTAVPIAVRETRGTHRAQVQLLAGQTVLGEISREVRFVTVTSVLPWAVLAVLVLGGSAVVAVKCRGRARRRVARG